MEHTDSECDDPTDLLDESDVDDQAKRPQHLRFCETEQRVLRKSFEELVKALGDREAVGDAIYGALRGALATLSHHFRNPKALTSLRLFNGFRQLCETCHDPQGLEIFLETLAFKHMGFEVTMERVEAVEEQVVELVEQNVELPGSGAVWRQLMRYAGTTYTSVCSTYGERLELIKQDWQEVQEAGDEDDETVVRSFPKMCVFSNEVMGCETEAWMEELLKVFKVLVEKIENPSQLAEECDLLALSMTSAYPGEIDLEVFKPVMLAALRSLLPKTWSTVHESAWEWLWETIKRNLKEATMKVRVFRPYNGKLFDALNQEQLEHFQDTIYSDFFSKCAASQELFKQSQSRLRYIADRVLQSSYDVYHMEKREMVDRLSALGLRHVGYGVPTELFGPFTDSCVSVMKPLIESMPKSKSEIMVWCPADGSHQLKESDVAEHMMVEGFRWSIGLVSRVLVRTITEGSTPVMQAIHLDDVRRLKRALLEAPRAVRCTWQLSVRVGSQSISPLFLALRTGAHETAKAMIQDVLTIRADRDRYYYGVNELFHLQPDIAEDVLQEAPSLASTLLDGLLWRSHKTKQGERPVIYYLEHLLQDTDPSKSVSRALKSFVKFKHPGLIIHPILTFTLDLLWERLARNIFIKYRLLTIFNLAVFCVAGCYLNNPSRVNHITVWILLVLRVQIYSLGLSRLIYLHTRQVYFTCAENSFRSICKGVKIPEYLFRSEEQVSLLLMLSMMGMLICEPLIQCLGSYHDVVDLDCDVYTQEMRFAYGLCVVFGIFLYAAQCMDLANLSIELSEYRVVCARAVKKLLLCLGGCALTIAIFSLAIAAVAQELQDLEHSWGDLSATMSTLLQLSVGTMDVKEVHEDAHSSPILLALIVPFMLMIYTFFFNLLVSQFCGAYQSLAADMQGYARLARGQAIMTVLEAVALPRWRVFFRSLEFEKRIDFEEGDLGLAGGIKSWEPALAHRVSGDPILRFGGPTDGSEPWSEKLQEEKSMEKLIQQTIQKSIQKMMGKRALSEADSGSSVHSSSHSVA